MKPTCEMVDQARIFLMSVWPIATMAAMRAVSTATQTTVAAAVGALAKMPPVRAMRYTPAVTMVAAWMSADTGVGPAMASGSQVCSGSCADLPAAARG